MSENKEDKTLVNDKPKAADKPASRQAIVENEKQAAVEVKASEDKPSEDKPSEDKAADVKSVSDKVSDSDKAPKQAVKATIGKSFTTNLVDFNNSQITDKQNKLTETNIGDYIRLGYRIIEGDKERVQAFEGTIIAKSGSAKNWHSTVTVRRVNQGYAVERVFPCFSPRVESVKILKKYKIRRAKLFYLRFLAGKKSRLKEKL